MQRQHGAAPTLNRKSAEELVRSARWALRTAWHASPSPLGSVVAGSVIRGLIPAGLALTVRNLVNAAIAGMGQGAPDLWPLAPWLGLGFALTVLEALLVSSLLLARQRLRDDLNCVVTADILAHAAELEVEFFEDPRSQDVLQRAKDNPAGHITGFVISLLAAVSSAIQIVTLLGVLVVIEPPLVIGLALLTVPYVLLQWDLATKHYELEHLRTTKRRWTAYFVGMLTNGASVAEVKLLGLAPLLIERFGNLMRELRDQDRLLYSERFRRSNVFSILATACVYAGFVHVAWRVLSKELGLGDLAIFGTTSARLRQTLETFVQLTTDTLEQTLYVSNVIELLEVAPRPPGESVAPARRAEIELQGVSFTYRGAPQPALENVDLRIEAGETVALVGENGAGKTTLVKLIAGLYEADGGRVLFDGVDVSRLSRRELYSRIAFVFQGFSRYEASARDNIAFGDWTRLLEDRARVEEIGREAGVDALIRSLPQAYETPLGRTFGERDLSSGEWQKLAVARAFARDAELLILDEPTASLDARAEHALFEQFQRLAHGRTTIIVSHRFSTVSMADRIVVLEKGRVVESGTHAELLAQAGSYANLYELHHRTRFQRAG